MMIRMIVMTVMILMIITMMVVMIRYNLDNDFGWLQQSKKISPFYSVRKGVWLLLG